MSGNFDTIQQNSTFYGLAYVEEFDRVMASVMTKHRVKYDADFRSALVNAQNCSKAMLKQVPIFLALVALVFKGESSESSAYAMER